MDMHRHPAAPTARFVDGDAVRGAALAVRRATTDEHSGFKLNNNYRSRYARLIMEQEADLEGVFQIRELTTP